MCACTIKGTHHANEARFEKWNLGRTDWTLVPKGGKRALFELFDFLYISLPEVYSVMTREFILAMKIQQVASNS